MVESLQGLRPDTDLVHTALTPFSGSLKCDWHVCTPLIDSSAVLPVDWLNWLNLLQQKLPDYDGILVLHGTDTLAYTANIFALSLNTQGKPIILTGAQKPFTAPQSDARANLQTAIAALQRDDINEVLIAFHGKLFPAVGSSKRSTEHDNGVHNEHFGTWQPQHAGSLKTFANHPRQFSDKVRLANLYLTPAQPMNIAAQILLHSACDGAIVQSYGHGNAPNDEDFLAAVQQFCQQGKLILNISQVSQGCAAAVYAQGNSLRESDMINGGRCNIETATAIMLLACANGWNRAQLIAELTDWQLLD